MPGEDHHIALFRQKKVRRVIHNHEWWFVITDVIEVLGEASTTEIARIEDTQGFHGNRGAARRGRKIAGNARAQLESETGKPVVSRANYLQEPETARRQLKRRDEHATE